MVPLYSHIAHRSMQQHVCTRCEGRLESASVELDHFSFNSVLGVLHLQRCSVGVPVFLINVGFSAG